VKLASTPQTIKPEARQAVGVCLVLFILTLAVFGQTTGFGFVAYDDNMYVYENPVLKMGLTWPGFAWVFTHAWFNLYHPLTMLSLMCDYQLHGLNAGWYHYTNVVLHSASAILLFLILRGMTGALWRSAFVAAVFAIHPLRAESVAWVAERKDVLAAFFFMLTLGAYARYARNLKSQISNFKFYYAATLFFFAMGLLSKPTVVTLPFVLLLLDYWPLQRAESARRLVVEKIPLLALSATACAATVLLAGKLIAGYANVSMSSRLGNAVVSCAVYLRQMIWPEGLAAFYPMPEQGYAFWTIGLSFLVLALITGGVLAFGRERRWLLTGWLWYLGMLTPMIGIVPVGAFAHADRMTYLPQIGLYLLLTWTVADLSAGWRYRRATLGGLAAIIVVALAFCARTQTAYWRDDETLWSHALDCIPDNGVARANLGADLLKKGKMDDAISFLQKGLQSEPDNSETHNNLGIALLQEGKVDEAILHFQRALEIDPENALAHLNLGSALGRKGRMEEAGAQYQKALQIKPSDPEIQNNFAWLLATCSQAALRNGSKAVELARQADGLTGGENPVILRTLAAALAEAGQFPEAVETARHALRLAEAQSNTRLAGKLQTELELYQAGRPFHVPAQTR
jgi:protein O-mannosyl-transferase